MLKEKVVAFVGQPNTGKSTWINALCGSALQTGNWNGVTVEKHEALLKRKNEILHVIDLPGIMGFDKQSDEERITEEFLKKERVDVIVQVMDACHMRSSLRLTMKLRLLQIPMICLINFKDEAEKLDLHIQTEMISKRLSIPVIYASALNPDEKDNLYAMILYQSERMVQYRPLLNPEADREFVSFLKGRSIHEASELFEMTFPCVWQKEMDDAVESCMKYVTGNSDKRNQMTMKLDQLLFERPLTKLLLVIVLIGVSLSVFKVSAWLSDGLGFLLEIIHVLIAGFFHLSKHELLNNFLNAVVFESIGALAAFMPLFAMLHFVMSCVEECGLMARITLLSDEMMRRFHLNGKSFLCFVSAHGCNVPAISASASLENEALRRKTALLIPFCSCTARLPVYLMLGTLSFGEKGMIASILLVGLGLFCVLFLSIVIELFSKKKIPEAQILELPVYRRPSMKVLVVKTMHHVAEYMKKVIQILFVYLCILWLSMNFPSPENSLYQSLIQRISVLFHPLGFGTNWMYTAALVSGLVAKEAIAGTLVMLKSTTGLSLIADARINLVYLVFVALSTPCLMTLYAQKRRYGITFALFSAFFSFLAAYALSWMLYQFIMFF